MKKDRTWLEAIIKVFEDEKKALHYTEIAELISEKGYKKSFGATPAATVSANINFDIKDKKEKSKFVRVNRGEYSLRKFFDEDFEPDKIEGTNKIIQSYGIYWDRNSVLWNSSPQLLGTEQEKATQVNFKEQIGIYILHDIRESIYVGKAFKKTIGERLYGHTLDRHKGRWDRFSWFGFYSVNNNGVLNKKIKKFENISLENMADTLEAILIESLEPRQNRNKRDIFFGIEYIQKEDPEIEKKKRRELLKEIQSKL